MEMNVHTSDKRGNSTTSVTGGFIAKNKKFGGPTIRHDFFYN